MARCEDCIHEKLCVIKAFPDAFENTVWDKKPCDHFKSAADVAPRSEVAREIFEEIGKLSKRLSNIVVNSEKAQWDILPAWVIKCSDFEELKKKYPEEGAGNNDT